MRFFRFRGKVARHRACRQGSDRAGCGRVCWKQPQPYPPSYPMVVERFLLGDGHDSLRMNSMNVCVQCGCGKSNRRQLKDNEMMVPTWHEDLRREPYGLPLLP